MKVLLTVASRHGSTMQIADCIREEIESKGIRVHFLEPELVTDLTGYDAVVLGSAVYGGRWLAAARKLAERCEAELQRKPLWLFSSGPVGDPANPGQPAADGPELARRLHAVDHQVFAGRMVRDSLGIGEGFAMRLAGAEEGDDRPWLTIGAWARGIARSLKTAPVPVAASVT